MLEAVFDISHWNGQTLGFNAAKMAGMLGVIHKGTQGVGYVDPMLASNRAKARAAGLLTGIYHFGSGVAAGADQAAFALDYAQPGDLVVLDFERNPTGVPMTLAQAADFMTACRARSVQPVLYAGGYLKGLLVGGVAAPAALTATPLFLADYRPVPSLPAGWSSFALWQWTDGGLTGPTAPPVPGIGRCDRDRFNGDAAGLQAFWGAHSLPGAA